MFRKKINSLERYLVFMIWFFTKRSKKVLHLEYRSFSDHLENTSEKEEIPDKDISINNITVNGILQKLTKFENSKRFLKKDINLTSLASRFDTNPRYLSEIIKHYRGKSFNGYINSLRIHHIIEKLQIEPVYREYKITYLAEYCGFASREVFAAAFKKEVGVTPSHFISQFRTVECK
jgi:AraC-like DNA-binding protein